METALPGPLTNDFADWIWRGQAAIPLDASDPISASGLHSYRFDIDSKAMRKVTLNQGIVLVQETFAIDTISSEVFEWQGYIAVLIKE